MKTYIRVFILSCTLCLICNGLLAQQKNKYLILDLEKGTSNLIGYNFSEAKNDNGNRAYLLNIRYKLVNNKRSWVGSDSDFLFTFYIIPGGKENGLIFYEIKSPQTIISNSLTNLDQIRDHFLNDKIGNNYEIDLVLKLGSKYYSFANGAVYGQAFGIKEDYHYFPQYSIKPNRFELNLLDKPYPKSVLDSLRKVEMKDTTSLRRFDSFLDYDKWYVNRIDKTKNTIDFWIRLSPVSPNSYSFGRITNNITFKINFGVTNFTISPKDPFLFDNYTKDKDSFLKKARFDFQTTIDLKKTILAQPLVAPPKDNKSTISLEL